jgi:hypothetical protein
MTIVCAALGVVSVLLLAAMLWARSVVREAEHIRRKYGIKYVTSADDEKWRE